MNEVLGQQKRRQLLAMLDHGMVMIHLDPRAPGVVVPPQFTDDPVLRLNIAYGFNLPALDIGPEGVYAILSFSRQNFGCTLPWDAIFAVTAPQDGHEGMVWPESIPAELAPFFGDLGLTAGAVPVSLEATGPGSRDAASPEALAEPDPEPEPEPRPRPLFVVHEGGRRDAPGDDDGAGDDDGDAPARDEDAPAPRPRPRLTVVKD